MLSEPLNNFQWLDQSSSVGVVTLKSESVTLIIIYDEHNQQSVDLVDQLDAHYHPRKMPFHSTFISIRYSFRTR